MGEKLERSEREWQELLDPETFRICRKAGTEPAFSGRYWDCHDAGIYRCSCCGQPLFDALHKFDSGSGWPSFWQPADRDAVQTSQDNSHGMSRTEVVCSRCDAHLGHVFGDGPAPTGQRYCINSASLSLDPAAEEH